MHITYIHRQNTSRTHEVGNEDREQTFSRTHTRTHTHKWKRGELSVNRLPAIDVNVIIWRLALN